MGDFSFHKSALRQLIDVQAKGEQPPRTKEPRSAQLTSPPKFSSSQHPAVSGPVPVLPAFNGLQLEQARASTDTSLASSSSFTKPPRTAGSERIATSSFLEIGSLGKTEPAEVVFNSQDWEWPTPPESSRISSPSSARAPAAKQPCYSNIPPDPSILQPQEHIDMSCLKDKVINSDLLLQLKLVELKSSDKYGTLHTGVQLTSGTKFEIRVYIFDHRGPKEKQYIRRNCKDWKTRRRFLDSCQDGSMVFLILRYPEASAIKTGTGVSATHWEDRSFPSLGIEDKKECLPHFRHRQDGDMLSISSRKDFPTVRTKSKTAHHPTSWQSFLKPTTMAPRLLQLNKETLGQIVTSEFSVVLSTKAGIFEEDTCCRAVMLQLGSDFFFPTPRRKTRSWIEKNRRNQKKIRQKHSGTSKSIRDRPHNGPTDGNSYYYSSDWFDSPSYGRLRKVVLLHDGTSRWWGNALLLDDEAQDAWWGRDKNDGYSANPSRSSLTPPPFMSSIEDIVNSVAASKASLAILDVVEHQKEHEQTPSLPIPPIEATGTIPREKFAENNARNLGLYKNMFGPALPKFDTNKSQPLMKVMMEFWFSTEGLIEDKLRIRRHMDAEGFIHLTFIATLRGIKTLTFDLSVFRSVCQKSNLVEYRLYPTGDEKVRVRIGWGKWVLPERMREASAKGCSSEIELASSDSEGTGGILTGMKVEKKNTKVILDSLPEPEMYRDGGIMYEKDTDTPFWYRRGSF